MVARKSIGTILRFANSDLTCWRCALRSTRRYEPILQRTTIIDSGNSRKEGAQRASQDPLLTGTLITQLNSLSRSVRKGRSKSTGSSGPLPYHALGEDLASTVSVPKNASSTYSTHRIIRGREPLFSPPRRWRYHTTGPLKNTVSDVKATPSVDRRITFNDVPHVPPAGPKIRKRLQLWQQQLESTVDPSSSFTAEATNVSGDDPRASHNVVTQSAADCQKIDGDEERENFSSLDDSTTYLQPGDILGVMLNREPIVGVYVRRFYRQDQIYTMTGKWLHTTSRVLSFVAEQTIPSEELDVILPYLPQEQISVHKVSILQAMKQGVPREAGAKLIQKMLLFHNSANQIVKKFAGRLNRIHEIIAHPTKRSRASLHEIAMKVLEKESREDLTDCMLWAVHSTLAGNDYCRAVSQNYRMHFMFDIMSRADAISLEKVRDWVREYQEGVVSENTGTQEIALTQNLENPIPGFVRKCRALIHESRKTRDAVNPCCIGPSSVKVISKPPDLAVWKSYQTTCFDEDEGKIIQFFHAWSTIGIIKPISDALRSTGSNVLRAIGMYEDFELDQAVGCLLLKELGLIPPWLNRAQYRPPVPLPGHHVDALTDELDFQAKKSVSRFQMEDCMKDVRRDWGDLEAFCIDDAGAHEIDDGLSLEEIDESSSWLHIHIANPSAFLAPSSAIGRNAAHRISACYFPEGNFPMMPEEITQPFFSLGNNRPCITFSAKVTPTGDILDTHISHGILRNTLHLTPEDVQRELGLEEESGEPPVTLTVGGRLPVMPARPNTSPLSSSQRRLLGRLYEISHALRRRRERASGHDSFFVKDREVQVYLGPGNMGMTKHHLHERTARRFEGDPIISMASIPNSWNWSGSTLSVSSMVGLMMTLAGEIGGEWCSKRNIPIPYKGTSRRINPIISPDLFKRKYMDPLTAKSERPPRYMIAFYFFLLGSMIRSPVPLRHIPLGVDAYAHVTSPLRRFTDLMTHWQIESAIRYESRTGKSLIGSTDESYLPFSLLETKRLIGRIALGENAVKAATGKSHLHWAHQLLFRAFHYKEAPLPECFNVFIEQLSLKSDTRYTGVIEDMELDIEVEDTEISQREGGIKIEDIWAVKITEVDCHDNRIHAEPIRLVKRPDSSSGPWTYC